jgi:hypothetical protein
MRFRLPQLQTSAPGDDAAAAGDDPPDGPAADDRGRHRRRGWSIAFGLALLAWALVAGVVVLVVALLR